LEAAERFVELHGGGFFRLAVDFGHKESLLAVAVAQRLAHPDFAGPVMVVQQLSRKLMPPSSAVRMMRTGFLFVGLKYRDAKPTQAHYGDAFATAAEPAIGNPVFGCQQPRVQRGDPGQK